MDTKELLTQKYFKSEKTIKLFKSVWLFITRVSYTVVCSPWFLQNAWRNRAKEIKQNTISCFASLVFSFFPDYQLHMLMYPQVTSCQLHIKADGSKPPQGRSPANSIRQASASDPDISSQWTPWKMADWSPLPPWRLGLWLIRHWFDSKWEWRALSCALNKEGWTRFPLSNCLCHEVTLAVNNRSLQLYGNQALILNTLVCMRLDRRMWFF